MPIEVLVVEDMDVLYKILLKSFRQALPMEEFNFTHVGTKAAALDVLDQDWDVILMDYHLGTQETIRDGVEFRNGADLVAYRRKIEGIDPEKKAYIIGMAGLDKYNARLEIKGTDLTCSRHTPGTVTGAEIIEHLLAYLQGER